MPKSVAGKPGAESSVVGLVGALFDAIGVVEEAERARVEAQKAALEASVLADKTDDASSQASIWHEACFDAVVTAREALDAAVADAASDYF